MLPGVYHRLRAHPAAAKVTKYVVGSVVALVTSIVVFAVLYVMGVGTTVDSIITFIAGAIPNWVLNRRWAWERTGKVEVAREVIGYVLVSIVALIASSVGTGLAQGWVEDNVAPGHGIRVVLVTGAYVLVQAILFVAKFLVYEHWVFAGRSRLRAAMRTRGQAIRTRGQAARTRREVVAAARGADRTP
jgi:putative flippase GtrA